MPNEYNVPKTNQIQHNQIIAEDKGKASSVQSLKVLLTKNFKEVLFIFIIFNSILHQYEDTNGV